MKRKLHRPKPKRPIEGEMPDARLFDLCRYQRSALLEAELITEEEYWWLLSECPLAQGAGSPSPRRLESYDALLERMAEIIKAAKEVVARWDTPLWKDSEPTAAVIYRLRDALKTPTPTNP